MSALTADSLAAILSLLPAKRNTSAFHLFHRSAASSAQRASVHGSHLLNLILSTLPFSSHYKSFKRIFSIQTLSTSSKLALCLHASTLPTPDASISLTRWCLLTSDLQKQKTKKHIRRFEARAFLLTPSFSAPPYLRTNKPALKNARMKFQIFSIRFLTRDSFFDLYTG